MMHCHTITEECTITDIISSQKKNSGSGLLETVNAPWFVEQFTSCRVRIATRIPVTIEKFDVFPQLGRFTLRDEGKTIAAGKILKYKPHTVTSLVKVAAEAQ